VNREWQHLLEALAYRAENQPDKVAYTFNDEPVPYSRLWQEITGCAGFLQAQGVSAGARVIMLFSNGSEFFAGFYALQLLGAVPIPLMPVDDLERILRIARIAEAAVVLLPSTTADTDLQRFRGQAEGSGLRLLHLEPDKFAPPAILPAVSAQDVAFIQFTSGSTGQPKGVMISHHNLVTNMRQMIQGMQITSQDIMVSWLPIYHDMGLILMTMVPFYLGIPTHLLPTNLAQVRLWAKAINKHGATFTAAPDFAYRLLLRRGAGGSVDDLSSLRVALNAAEPVRAVTIREFHQMYNLENVMVAGYGLAELTVGVSMWPPGSANRVDGRGFVSVGPPFPLISIRILDGETELPVGEIGEIAIRSVANTRGYYGSPEESQALRWGDGYIRSGDLGYLDWDGHLYIVGRQKNAIKHIGRTLAPSELEQIADSFPEVRASTALGIDRGKGEGEQIYIFAEVRMGPGTDPARLHELSVAIVDRVHSRLGVRPARAYLVKPRTIPRTHNGKVQHQELKGRYLSGALRADDQILYPDY
jgi:acyl-CoA synthetase (AMP-forming)/AMP-acid ligase II